MIGWPPATAIADCLISPAERLSYAGLAERVNRIANVLTRDLGMVPGNRVLLRGPNSPMMVAAYFAVIKAGGIVVATMPLLRAKEIAFPITKAEIRLALCDVRLADELEKARPLAPLLDRVVYWGSGAADSLEALMNKPGYEQFAACDTASDDVCLIAFTSGTTGVPKGTMHFHRDMLAICDDLRQACLAPGVPRSLHRLAADRVHVRGRRPGAVPAARRCRDGPPGEGRAGRSLAGNREISRLGLLHRTDGLPLHARQDGRPRPLVIAEMRFRRRNAAQG